MFKNYQSLVETLVDENYHPFWPTFLTSLSEDDYQELAYEYWNWLQLDEKKKWLIDPDFVEVLSTVITGIHRHDIDDTMAASSDFMESLKDFFIDEIITDLEKAYFSYEFKSLYDQESESFEAWKYSNDVVNG